jgi:hypothetical protein
MPDLNLSKALSNDDCDALASHVAIASNKTATIAVRTAGATSPLSPKEEPVLAGLELTPAAPLDDKRS